MALRFKNKVIAAETEAVYGVAETLVGADAILTRDFELTPLEGDRQSRELDRPTLGASPVYLSQVRRRMRFKVELAGAGGADTVPGYGPLITACGFDETVTASTMVEYDPITADGDSLTIGFNLDGRNVLMTGARGAVGFEFVAGSYPYLQFDFIGLLVAAADAAQLTPVYTPFQQPVRVNDANTPTFALHGVSTLVLQSLIVRPGQQVNYRNWVNQEAVRIGDRAYAATAVFLAPTLTAFNYDTKARTEALGTLQLVHGVGAGNIVQLDAAAAQITDWRDTNDGGDLVISAELLLTATAAGNDDAKLTTK